MNASRHSWSCLILGAVALAMSAGPTASTARAQARIEIPPQEFERSLQRFDLSTLSQDEAMNLMSMLFKGMRGGSGEPSPGVATAESAPAFSGTTGAGSGVPAPHTVSVFPQIPPAVAGTKHALGRWMMFQANLLQKLGEAYAEYGEELLAENAPKPASGMKPPDPAKTPEAKVKKK